jgi:HK97 family phage major capsid protein
MKHSDALKAKLKQILENLQALQAQVEASETKELSEEQLAQVEKALEEEKRLVKQIEVADELDRATARASSVPASAPADARPGYKAEARPRVEMAPQKKLLLTTACQLKGYFTGQSTLKVLSDEGYEQIADEVAERNGFTKSVNTLTNSAGGILMPTPARGALLDLLYPEMTFLQGNPQRVPLTGGAYDQPFGATGGSASYVGEAAKKPITDVTFDKISMKSKKLAAIVMITKEARKWLVPEIEAYVERQMRIFVPAAMNTAMYLGTGSGDTPTGIFNKSGIGSYAASTTGYFAAVKAPTTPELDNVTSILTAHLTDRYIIQTGRWAWIMSPRTLRYLKNLRIGANLERAFPELQGENPTWYGVKVLVEYALPQNTGTGTDETILGLVNFDDVLFGEEQALRTDVSDQATIDNSGTLVHLFQQNMIALLAEMEHDVGVQRAASVVKLTAVRWGAP